MEILDWLFIGLLSLAILCFVFTVIYFVLRTMTTKKLKQVEHRRPKKKEKRKKWARHCRMLAKKAKKELKKALILLSIGLLALAGAFYSQYYQATNLGKKDSAALVQGYYLVTEISEQVQKAPTTDNPQKVQATLRNLSARLASYGARSADRRLSEEGQAMLNRLYKNMKELGLNMNNQSIDSLKNPDTYASYLTDIEKTEANQKKVFQHFHIDEKSLQTNK